LSTLTALLCQERGRRRALDSLHKHMSKKLPQYEEAVQGLHGIVATLQTVSGESADADGVTSIDVMVENSKRLATSVDQLRAIIPK
jgi:hypothetical protein